MGQLENDLKPGYFLEVSNWWGLSRNPGARGMFVYPDQTYIVKEIYFKNPDQNVTRKGTLDPTLFDEVRKFIAENIQKSTHNMIFDAGCTVKVHTDTQTLTVENDMELFRKIRQLLPYNDPKTPSQAESGSK